VSLQSSSRQFCSKGKIIRSSDETWINTHFTKHMILQHKMMVAKDALFFQKMFNMAKISLWDRKVANSRTIFLEERYSWASPLQQCNTIQNDWGGLSQVVPENTT
jgi:hypothetical protein